MFLAWKKYWAPGKIFKMSIYNQMAPAEKIQSRKQKSLKGAISRKAKIKIMEACVLYNVSHGSHIVKFKNMQKSIERCIIGIRGSQ